MKRMRYAVLTLGNGDTRMIQVKTTTERYMRKLIADLRLPSPVVGYEFV